MHRLARQIRFLIDPFAKSPEGANSYCAKPTANGIALLFSLWIELEGSIDKDTGFVLNVFDIDRITRDKAFKILNRFIKQKFQWKEQISFEETGRIVGKIWRTIEKDLLPARISSLILELTPARKIVVKDKGGNMLYFSEKFEFAASHTLWNKKFNRKQNEKIFGKCANPKGHGHNYIIEVTVKKNTASIPAVEVQSFENVVKKEFINVVDHKNLNVDVSYFKKANPTVENIAEFAFKCLKDKLKPLELDSVTVWENDRTFCTFKAD